MWTLERLAEPALRRVRHISRFTDGIHWPQCQDSVRRAVAFWRPLWITFCFAHDLSAIEQESFRTELVERFREVRLDVWSASELQRLIRDTEEGQRAAAWLWENPSVTREEMIEAMKVGGPLHSKRHAAERRAVIQEYTNRDPHFIPPCPSHPRGSGVGGGLVGFRLV